MISRHEFTVLYDLSDHLEKAFAPPLVLDFTLKDPAPIWPHASHPVLA